MTRALAIAVVLTACHQRPPIESCDDDLHGVWKTDDGASWMMLDNGPTLEAYPLFDDSVPGGAPRVIDLTRTSRVHAELRGEVKRRFMRNADECVASAPIRVAKCKADSLQIVVAEPVPPVGFTPCAWGKPSESSLVHWRRTHE